jgi:hypothetical protein
MQPSQHLYPSIFGDHQILVSSALAKFAGMAD